MVNVSPFLEDRGWKDTVYDYEITYIDHTTS